MFCTFSLQNVLFATAACIFFDRRTAKSASDLTCFVHFHFKMCFSPQRRAFFRQENSKKRFGPDVFLYIFTLKTSKCAFRHSGVQFLMCPLTTYLRTRRFNGPIFRLTRHTNHRKNTAFRDFSNIWRGCIFFLLTFALLHLLSADLTTLLCFSTVHIVGSFYLNFLRQTISRIVRVFRHHLNHAAFRRSCSMSNLATKMVARFDQLDMSETFLSEGFPSENTYPPNDHISHHWKFGKSSTQQCRLGWDM